jgi:F-type H+-transporting ATPase subunit delta
MAEPITIARPYARAAFESASAAAALAPWDQFLWRTAAWVREQQVQPLIGDPRVPASQLIALLLELASAGVPPVAEGDVPLAEADETVAQAGAGSAQAPAASGSRLEPGQLIEEQRNFLALLAHNGRLPLLPEIAVQYRQLRAEAEQVADVQVSSARQLTPEQTAGLKNALEQRLGRAVRLHERVDAALLGGAVVRFGDFVIDGSLRRRVERLAATMTGG